MKKILLLFFAFVFSLSLSNPTKAESYENSFKLLKITNGNSVSFAYLFPVNSYAFENIDSISYEGFKYYLKNTVSLLSDGYEEKAEGIEGISVSKPNYYSDYDAVGFIIKFDNITAFNEYFEVEDEPITPKKSGVFIRKSTYNISFPFSKASADSLISLMKNTVIMWGETFNKDTSMIVSLYDHSTFIYELVSTSKQARSEKMSESGGLYYNTFERTYEELAEAKPITIYYLEINRAVWYLMALILVVVLLIVVLVWYRLSTKRKKSKS